jgi:dTDP-4-amino-4,6-dideoxygalactose transaminase
MSNPFAIIEEFEAAICDYTGAPYAVAVNSATNALFLSLVWWRQHYVKPSHWPDSMGDSIWLPKRTYVSVPMSVIHAGWRARFVDKDWEGGYDLHPLPLWDYARRFTGGMYRAGTIQCVSFHWSKPLGIQHGGAILHDNISADDWLRRARFDGRLSGESAGEAKIIGWHCLTTPEVAAAGLVRISLLPPNNPDAPKPDYPDLSKMELFR